MTHLRPALLIFASFGLCLTGATTPDPLVRDDFHHGMNAWSVEQMPGGTVTARDGVLVIEDAAPR